MSSVGYLPIYNADGAIELTPAQAFRIAEIASVRVPLPELNETLAMLGVKELAQEHARSVRTGRRRNSQGRYVQMGGMCRHDLKPRVCGKRHRRG